MEYKDDVVPELLDAVQKGFQKNMTKNRQAATAVMKVEAGTATYKDVDRYAEAVGQALRDAFSSAVTSDVLPGGHMYYNIAQGLIQPTLETNHGMVADVAEQVQNTMNTNAGIGIKAVRPDFDMEYAERLMGVATRKANYDDVAEEITRSLKTFTQKVADDAAKENFDFQARSGLSPKIQRISTGKCCDWCESLVGTYDYDTVNNTGNDVFLRHANCNCIVEFIPADGKGKRQDVYSKRYYSEEESAAIKARAMSLAEERATNKTASQRLSMLPKGENVTPEYMRTAAPGTGVISRDPGFNAKGHDDEIRIAKWINEVFGGDIRLLKEGWAQSPDYEWKGKLWDLKTPEKVNSITKRIQKGLQQIYDNPGGIIINIEKVAIKEKDLERIIDGRMKTSQKQDTDIIIVDGEKLLKVLRYKK